jgi:hypothetical protein
MSHATEHGGKFTFSSVVLWVAAIVLIYLFCSGPVTRWYPSAADIIYAPLSPLAENKTLGKPLRSWLSLWGVNTGE